MIKLGNFSAPRLLWQSVKLMKDILPQGKIFLIYAGALTIVNIFLGQWTFSCGSEQSWWCYTLKAHKYVIYGVWGIYVLLQFYLYGSFGYDIYNRAINHNHSIRPDIFTFTRGKLLFVLLLIVLSALFLFPLWGVYEIMVKAPNPDWRIEFGYFTALFILCWVPVLILRMSSVVSYYLSEYRIPSIREMLAKTKMSLLNTVFSFAMLFVIFNMFHLQFAGLLEKLAYHHGYFVVAVFTEFVNSLLKLFYFSLILMYLRAVQETMDRDESNEPVLCSPDVPEEQFVCAPAIESIAAKVKKSSAKKNSTGKKSPQKKKKTK